MRSRQGLWALSALVQSLYPRAAAAVDVENCDQMGATYTGSVYEFSVRCDTTAVNGAIYAYYSVGDTFASCIPRCDLDADCIAALFIQASGDCALLAAYASDRPFMGNDLAVKEEVVTTSTTDISTTDVSTTDVSTTDVTTTDVSTTDISTTDVSTTDASTTDVSTTDASTTDASTTDASDAQTTTSSTTDSTTASDALATTTSQTTSGSSDTSSTDSRVSTTETSTLATSTTSRATSQGSTDTQSTTSTIQTSDVSTSPSASSTPARNIPVVDDYVFTGCLSSREGYPSFVGVATDPEMTTEKCISLAAGSKYIGIYQESCYKADSLSETDFVADEQCDLVCPGDHSLFCGGSTGDGRKLFGRAIAATRLLTLYRQKVASTSSASLTTLVTDSKTVPAYDSTITKTASASRLTVSCSTSPDGASTSTDLLAEMVTTVTYATINPTKPAGLITTCVPVTLLYSPCNCEHQVYPSVEVTTVAYTQASNTITLTVPKAALETGSESDTSHPIIQYPSSWDINHPTDAASGGYSMALPTGGWQQNSQSDTPTSPSPSSGSDQGRGSSEPHDAPDSTAAVVSKASRPQFQFWIATIAIMGLFMG